MPDASWLTSEVLVAGGANSARSCAMTASRRAPARLRNSEHCAEQTPWKWRSAFPTSLARTSLGDSSSSASLACDCASSCDARRGWDGNLTAGVAQTGIGHDAAAPFLAIPVAHQSDRQLRACVVNMHSQAQMHTRLADGSQRRNAAVRKGTLTLQHDVLCGPPPSICAATGIWRACNA
jgi:hypothetical protein